ncbi:Debranching enzyme [Tieghemostelium lacteum]|uniref:Debranching enzyme n=1 Tax=Tieghemostelium lacteum TaxID=361077 RepID=A0A151ZGA1_TIELA|nr:Debranching enzyme [Tieghemostelium lacteum]|eukprot:KYQ92955.1 Debranching enzyme [Tieghemostelium lacteum]
MRIAIEGCCHGEVETIYNSLVHIEQKTNSKIDLLLCCGDYEALRNQSDLKSLAVKDKYRQMGSFYKYYSGELVAPILTLVIGGNHESSNYFSELPNGGWLAPNIYYMGRSGVVTFGGLRIMGISGIYKQYDYQKGYYERKPFSEDHIRSIYHVREMDILKLSALSVPRLDIAFSHDWPLSIVEYGNKAKLLKQKKGFEEDINKDALGNPATLQLLRLHKPKFWFSGHCHVKFPAVYPHTTKQDQQNSNENLTANTSDNDDSNNVLETRFLALDKVLPNRDFLQVLDFEAKGSLKLCYDIQWLLILAKTQAQVKQHTKSTASPLNPNDFKNLYTVEEIERFEGRFELLHQLKNPNNNNKEFSKQDILEIPKNFVQNAYCHNANDLKNICAFDDPYFDNPQEIVLNNLINVLSSNTEINEETLKQLNVETFSKSVSQQNKKIKYVDDSEINIDD